MRRMVGTTGLPTGPMGVLGGEEIRRLLDHMDRGNSAGPEDAVRSQVLFEQMMVRLAAQERRSRRGRQLVQLARAAVAVITGAGAFRLLVH
jgi:hypothetical protein